MGVIIPRAVALEANSGNRYGRRLGFELTCSTASLRIVGGRRVDIDLLDY